jgi:hypothetical protein
VEAERRALARALRISLLATLVSSFFLSMAYAAVIWLMLALASAVATSPMKPEVQRPGRRA